MAQPSSVYDPESEERSIPQSARDVQPDLPVDTKPSGDPSDAGDEYDPQTTPMGDSSDPRGDLKKKEQEGGLFNPDGDNSSSSSDQTKKPSSQSGKAGGEGFSFNPEDPDSRSNFRTVLRAASGNKKRNIFGGGVIAGLVMLAVVAFFIMIPLKIEHVVTNLEKRFFSTSENAVSKESEHMLSRYITQRVLPTMRSCGAKSTAVIHKGCNPRFGNSSNPVEALYKGWSDAKLENTLATKYGIEFKYNTQEKSWYLKAPGSSSSGDRLGDTPTASKLDNEFKRSDRKGMREAVRGAMENETRWKKVMYRFKVGRLLEEKYGIKRCILFCGTRDSLADKRDARKQAAKLYLIERVITPRQASLGVVLGCIFNAKGAKSCDKPADSNKCAKSPCGELANQPQSQIEADVAEAVGEASSAFGSETADKLLKVISDARDAGGFSNYATKKVLTKLLNEEVAQKSVPVIGQVEMLYSTSHFIETAANGADSLKKYSYIVNSGAAVGIFYMWRSYSDEVHTGHMDPTELGSFNRSLGPGNQCDKSITTDCSEHPPGGTSSAEGSPLYQNIINDAEPASRKSALLDGGLFPSAFAASSSSSSGSFENKCNDGKPVPSGKLVCSEEVLGQGNGAVSAVSGALKSSGLATLAHSINNFPILSTAFNAVNDISSWLLGGASSALESAAKLIPGVSGLLSSAEKLAGKFFSFMMNKIIPSPIAVDMSGSRTFDMMAAGADVSGNDYAHTGLGGKRLNSAQVATIVNEQRAGDRASFARQSLVARMFSTDSQYSLVSRLAMAIPFNTHSATVGGVSSMLTSPFGTIFHSFSSFLSPKVTAATQAQDDPFGVTQYGYEDSDIPSDPETYWNQHCSDNPERAYQNETDYQAGANKKGWNGDSETVTDRNNGMPVNTRTNPCLLIKATVGAAGGIYDKSLLTEDDLADLNNQGGADTSGTDSTASADINTADLFKDSTKVACAANTKDLGVQDGYTQGKKVKIRICAVSNLPSSGEESKGGYGVSGANGKAIVNSRVSGAVYAMAEAANKDGLSLAVNSAFRTMAHQQDLCPCDGKSVAVPGTSNHQMGLALDISGLPSSAGPIPGNQFWDWLSKNASKFGYKNYPAEAWHWSPTGN